MADALHVRAVEGRLIQPLHDDGRAMIGAPYVGYDVPGPTRKIIKEGVLVPNTSHWQRLVNDGDLELVEDAPAPSHE